MQESEYKYMKTKHNNIIITYIKKTSNCDKFPQIHKTIQLFSLFLCIMQSNNSIELEHVFCTFRMSLELGTKCTKPNCK